MLLFEIISDMIRSNDWYAALYLLFLLHAHEFPFYVCVVEHDVLLLFLLWQLIWRDWKQGVIARNANDI